MIREGLLKSLGRNSVIFSVGVSLLMLSLNDVNVVATKKTTKQVFDSLKNCEGAICSSRCSKRSNSSNYAVAPLAKRKMFFGISGGYVTKGRRTIDATKVIKLEQDGGSDKKFSLIATQSPLYRCENIYGRYFSPDFNTLSSFWDLLFTSEQVDCVVSLGAGERYKTGPRLLSYWKLDLPEDDTKNMYKVKQEKLKDVCSAFRTNITISKSKKQKTIDHYNYYYWPNWQFPTNKDNFEAFVKHLKGKRKLVVHCSDGTGRISIFAACMYALKTECTNPVEVVNELRDYRIANIRKSKQFDFLCKFIARNCVDLESRGLNKPDWNEEIDYNAYFG